jgi:hypothetical protein
MPTYKIAKALTTLALELLQPPGRLTFKRMKETMRGLADASSDKSFDRYTKVLQEVFDGVSRPALEVDRENRELRLSPR